MQSLIYQNLAIIYFRFKEKEKAHEHYQKAYLLCRNNDDKLGEMQILFNMAMLDGENWQKSIDLYQASLKIAIEIDDKRFIMANYENLSEMYAELKDYEQAYYFKLKAQRLERELFGMERTKSINELKNRFDEEWRVKEMADLQRRNDELKHFVQKAVHEIKEPLRMVSSFGQILSKKYAKTLDVRGQEYLNYMIESTNHLNKMLSSLIDYGMVGIDTARREVDLNEVIMTVIGNFREVIQATNTVVLVQTLPKVIANETSMVQLFENIIDNAIKFRRELPPRLEVQCREEEDKFILSFKDNGIGIALEHQERIFKVFEKVHSKSIYEGNGIGLSIALRIVEMINGKLWLESREGIGTTFFISIPKF
jgi:signal transduction histidine kinase